MFFLSVHREMISRIKKIVIFLHFIECIYIYISIEIQQRIFIKVIVKKVLPPYLSKGRVHLIRFGKARFWGSHFKSETETPPFPPFLASPDFCRGELNEPVPNAVVEVS